MNVSPASRDRHGLADFTGDFSRFRGQSDRPAGVGFHALTVYQKAMRRRLLPGFAGLLSLFNRAAVLSGHRCRNYMGRKNT